MKQLYREGEYVWLRPFAETNQPRQKVPLLHDVFEGDTTATGEIQGVPYDSEDDGVCEFTLDQIEGLA